MKVSVKKLESNICRVPINTEFIRLEALLKLVDAVPSGGVAKAMIQDGDVLVNGEICTMRGKKLRPGDMVHFMDQDYAVTENEN